MKLDGELVVVYDHPSESPTCKPATRKLHSPFHLERPRYDEHLCALHAGNYRLRPKVIEVNKWLFLSSLEPYSSILTSHHDHCAD